ncbi:hypothetical protein [Dinoroseobacter sp. S124A]|uniref:hypothetical protein n=1 Tax=Dinoroseobacter sp. S124A TaxID=3415128 RepID=UPI003C7D440F
MAEKKDKIVTILLAQSELDAIDGWRYENRIPSRGEALRQLIRLGFTAHQLQQKKTEAKG